MAAAFDSRFCLCGGALRRSKDIQNAIPDGRGSFTGCVRRRRSSSAKAASSSSASLPQPVRYAVLGAGFAGLSVAWHLLESNPKESPLVVDLYDEGGIGGGASGVAGGLIHPCSPKGKLLWRSAEFWRECLKLLSAAEQTLKRGTTSDEERMIWRRGIIRPATTMKNAEILKENASNSLSCFRREFLDRDAAQKLVPGLCVSFDSSIYMPHAVNIHAGRYLQALFSACKSMADDASSAGSGRMEVNLFKRSIESLHELQGNYNCVIICLGAKAAMLPELSGLLPLRLCRGIVTHMKLLDATSDVYEDGSPSILSDAWLAVQGPRSLVMGSTWDWGSRDYSSSVSPEEASRALDELLPKAASVYPATERWAPVGASGGLRAMPPLTSLGSLPLLGCLDDIVGDKGQCRYWLVGGLGARGLLYHGLLGKLTSQAVMSQDEDILPSELTSWKRLLLKARG